MTQKAGIIGVGLMGGAIASRLIQSGVELTVFDIDQAAAQRQARLGGVAAASLDEITECETVLVCLPNDAIVFDVLVNQGLLSKMGGGTLIELSTILPQTMKKLAEHAAAAGVSVVDSPVSGGPGEAAAGKLVLMVGAEEADLDRVRPLLEPLGAIELIGEVGHGKALKLVNNVMSMCNVAIASEAFTLGASFGLDPQRLYQVLSTSGGRSGQFIKRMPYALDRDFRARFAITMAEKDLRLAIEMAHGISFPMPLVAGIHQLYEQAIAAGLGGEDQIAVIKLYEQYANGAHLAGSSHGE